MIGLLRNLVSDQAADLRGKLLGIYAFLFAINIAAWAWALLAFRQHALLLGTALLAYGLGLRHAVDADHIAAIDNVTRKLMQESKRPVAAGLYFSLGHSTVVILASAAIAVAAGALSAQLDSFKGVGGIIGTSVSALFLLAIAIANLFVLAAVHRIFQRVKRGGRLIEADLDILLAQRGLLARLLRRLFRLIGKSWHMYPLGFLFGLGFDTATEIGLLGIAAAEASRGLPIWSILVFPALFTAGMSLIDTTDGVLMIGAYGWAFVKPIRKLYYNMTITFISVLVAVAIAGIEALGLLADKFSLTGPFWELIELGNESSGAIGCGIVGLFTLSWLASIAIYRIRGYDRIEVKTGA